MTDEVLLPCQKITAKSKHQHLLTLKERGQMTRRPQTTQDFPEEEKEKVKKLVYILDRFGVSIQAYHEITQLEGNDVMARSYVIEECQADLNESVTPSRTPGQCPGAEMHFPALLEEQVMKHVSNQIQINLLLKGAICANI